jgi:hypothetical protein
MCSCGRGRANAEDLERWNRETEGTLGRGLPDVFARVLSGSGTGTWTHLALPEWSLALCWTRPNKRCNMRRRWASEPHIGMARLVFRTYVMELERRES